MPKGIYLHRSAPVEERFWKHIEPEPNSGCWLWIGARLRGYGIFDALPHRYAHRFAFCMIAGKVIPEGKELDHLCRVRSCVNPAHLEPVTRRENFLRGQHPTAIRYLAGVCPHGHSMADAYQDKRRGRMCRTCVLARYHRIGRDQRRARLAREIA